MRKVLFLAVLLSCGPAFAAEPAVLQLGAGDHYSLSPYFEYTEDREGKLIANDLIHPSPDLRFSRFSQPDGQVNFGYSRSVFWLKALLQTQGPELFFLEIAYPTLDQVQVFLVGPGGSFVSAEAGDLQPFSRRAYPHHNLVFPLRSIPVGTSTLLIRVQSAGSLTVPAELWREPAFFRHSINEYVVLSLYFGILLALFFCNLLLYLSLRDRVYLAYIGFVAAMAVGQLSQSGLGNEFLWPEFPAWGNVAFPAGFAATGFFGAVFTRLFLDSPGSIPRLDRVITALAAGFAFAALSPLFFSYQTTAIVTSLLGVVFSAVAVAAGVICLLKKHPGARSFLAAWTLLLFGVAMLGMRNLAWLPTTFVTQYGMQIGSALEMLLLSFALADRVNQVRREKDAAQQRALTVSIEKERELASKAQEWEETFNSISDMVVILDRNRCIVKANKAAVNLLGRGTAAVAGMTCHDLHQFCEFRPGQCPCLVTFAKGASATREFFEPKSKRHLEISTSPILNGSGEIQSAIHITKDITWRKKAEEELIRTEKLNSLAVLAGGIAHDFNNMLTIIMSTTTLAKMYAKDDARVVAKISEAEREIMHARELTNQLLTFAKGGAPVKRLSSFRDLLSDTVEFSLSGANARCAISIASDLWPAEIDRTQISQVISNIALNASQAMPEGGTIRVTAENAVVDEPSGMPLDPGRYVRIAFEDMGAGIAPEHLPKIFDPFFTTKPGGSGLGLSTSYSIVNKHSGYIDVKSQPGAGAVFTVYLPASDGEFAEPSAPAPRELKGGGRVMLMDDDEKLLRSVGEMLDGLGYEVEAARNGEEALILYRRAKAQSRPFDAVVLDVMVAGGMGGKDCIARLLEIDPGVKALVVSGYSDDAVLADYRRYGFREALPKPFSIQELQDKLQKVILGGADA